MGSLLLVNIVFISMGTIDQNFHLCGPTTLDKFRYLINKILLNMVRHVLINT